MNEMLIMESTHHKKKILKNCKTVPKDENIIWEYFLKVKFQEFQSFKKAKHRFIYKIFACCKIINLEQKNFFHASRKKKMINEYNYSMMN